MKKLLALILIVGLLAGCTAVAEEAAGELPENEVWSPELEAMCRTADGQPVYLGLWMIEAVAGFSAWPNMTEEEASTYIGGQIFINDGLFDAAYLDQRQEDVYADVYAYQTKYFALDYGISAEELGIDARLEAVPEVRIGNNNEAFAGADFFVTAPDTMLLCLDGVFLRMQRAESN